MRPHYFSEIFESIQGSTSQSFHGLFDPIPDNSITTNTSIKEKEESTEEADIFDWIEMDENGEWQFTEEYEKQQELEKFQKEIEGIITDAFNPYTKSNPSVPSGIYPSNWLPLANPDDPLGGYSFNNTYPSWDNVIRFLNSENQHGISPQGYKIYGSGKGNIFQ